MIVFNSLLFKCCLFSLAYAVLVCAASVTDSNRGEEHSADRTVSAEVFNSLEELSRVVDVSYCVGTSGVQKPFECLSHCKDLEGFELVTVSRPTLFTAAPTQPFPLVTPQHPEHTDKSARLCSDMEHRSFPLRFLWLHRILA